MILAFVCFRQWNLRQSKNKLPMRPPANERRGSRNRAVDSCNYGNYCQWSAIDWKQETDGAIIMPGVFKCVCLGGWRGEEKNRGHWELMSGATFGNYRETFVCGRQPSSFFCVDNMTDLVPGKKSILNVKKAPLHLALFFSGLNQGTFHYILYLYNCLCVE